VPTPHDGLMQQCLAQRNARKPKPVAEITAPMPYMPCPNRGTHLTLQKCWACWCDVPRGGCLPSDVLPPRGTVALSDPVKVSP